MIKRNLLQLLTSSVLQHKDALTCKMKKFFSKPISLNHKKPLQ